MQPSRIKAQRRALDTVLEKGILITVFGIVFLISPLILKGSATLVAVANGLRTAGWWVLGAGLALICLHLVLLRLTRNLRHYQPEASASRFQHSILPDELLYPPSRVRLAPMLQDAPETDPYEPSTIPTELDAQDTLTQPEPEQAWGPRVWTQIEWRRFEAVCEALFAQVGFQTRAEPQSGNNADGGMNIWLQSRNAQGLVAVLQCKHWQRKPVGIKELRELQGAMASQQLKRGTYAASGRYSRDALQFAQEHGIHVLDGTALLALIARRKPDQQQALLNVAYEGEYWRPTCASCGTKMVERDVSPSGSAFWGCVDYPRCRNTLSIGHAV